MPDMAEWTKLKPKLRQLFKEGLSDADIAKRLSSKKNKVPRHAVTSKLFRMRQKGEISYRNGGDKKSHSKVQRKKGPLKPAPAVPDKSEELTAPVPHDDQEVAAQPRKCDVVLTFVPTSGEGEVVVFTMSAQAAGKAIDFCEWMGAREEANPGC